MTVVLLDPLRPTTIPMEAVGVVGGGVEFTDEVPEAVRALLSAAPGAAVLISTDPDHPTVREWVASGSRIIAAPKVPGDNLVEAAEVMDRLWSYGGWEVTQTHRTLSHYLVEETYEVLDAIESAEPADLREELGDLLLQVLFHSRIASASGNFDVDDVAATLVAKLVHRSPHLGEDVVGPIDIAEQERAWEVRKAAEKARSSCLDGVAMSQPAASLAAKVIARASKAGLPPELVPGEITADSAAVVAAESRLQAATADLIARVRAAEDAARAAGKTELAPADWLGYWTS
ncbi:MazG family protein [Rhodococcus sp. USK10]|uniref:Nucleoside triphosphate pyrophosphohydrolase MazG n=1 Tax=Rhodococcus wratislaviensis TaxID=44752 RepID=A0A402BYL0_RHOWR|nr:MULTISPECIES: MazG family protein [Rhodococcus]QYB03105.1 MazG family protein [Rhodococcus sp. USK10]GCE36426.1 Nucleoside triphosphate pyrophosphohydrolase MazG [Rhodococcus wratislaviensis]